jgi:hypothetical protein
MVHQFHIAQCEHRVRENLETPLLDLHSRSGVFRCQTRERGGSFAAGAPDQTAEISLAARQETLDQVSTNEPTGAGHENLHV